MSCWWSEAYGVVVGTRKLKRLYVREAPKPEEKLLSVCASILFLLAVWLKKK